MDNLGSSQPHVFSSPRMVINRLRKRVLLQSRHAETRWKGRFRFLATLPLTELDSVGTTKYTYTAAGQLLTEDGPFASDTVSNTYVDRLRTGLSLQQPTGAWTNGFGWDAAKRLTNVTSQAGSFNYSYLSPRAFLVSKLALPNGAYITNTYDSVARLTTNYLKNSVDTA